MVPDAVLMLKLPMNVRFRIRPKRAKSRDDIAVVLAPVSKIMVAFWLSAFTSRRY